MVIFDFDNTLFDTESLKQSWYEMACVHGYTHTDAEEIYRQSRVNGARMAVSMSAYITALRMRVEQDGKTFLFVEVSDSIERMKQGPSLLPGARMLLAYCVKHDLDRYILSLGVREWQEEKIARAGVSRYIPSANIMYTDSIDTGKIQLLRERFGEDFSGADTILWNDKPDETATLLDAFPQLIAFVRREVRDVRYPRSSYDSLLQKYPQRVRWSTDLRILFPYFVSHYE